MTHVAARQPRRSLFHAIPVLGWIARDLSRNEEDLWYLLVAALSLLVIATVTWGPAVLSLTALAMVPVMFVVLIRITLG